LLVMFGQPRRFQDLHPGFGAQNGPALCYFRLLSLLNSEKS
jgi:hypothetical protein